MYLLEIFISFFVKGGPVMWPILGVSVVVWAIGLDKMYRLMKLMSARKRFRLLAANMKHGSGGTNTGHDAYDNLLHNLKKVRYGEASLSFCFRRFLVSVMPELDDAFSTMSAWISVAPLLGLLGTVSGMIKTFEIIQVFGIGNPHMMSGGISIALLTTQAGLTAAFPGMLLHNYLLNLKNRFAKDVLKDEEYLGTVVCGSVNPE
jgi:biopolymer transport protein ExbB